jgi:hypothetical protein
LNPKISRRQPVDSFFVLNVPPQRDITGAVRAAHVSSAGILCSTSLASLPGSWFAEKNSPKAKNRVTIYALQSNTAPFGKTCANLIGADPKILVLTGFFLT